VGIYKIPRLAILKHLVQAKQQPLKQKPQNTHDNMSLTPVHELLVVEPCLEDKGNGKAPNLKRSLDRGVCLELVPSSSWHH
jgi:hypothetical protein